MTNTDPFTLDPAVSSDALSAGYIMQIYSGLLKLDNNLEPVPDIAAEYADDKHGRPNLYISPAQGCEIPGWYTGNCF